MTTTTPPTTPHSREAEEAVLGALLIDGEEIRKLALSPEDFYIQRNRMVYSAMLDLHREHVTLDFLTLCDRLERAGKLADVGGHAYIMGLINATPSALNIGGHAEIIRERASRRRMVLAAQELARAAYDLGSDTGAARSSVMDALARTAVSDKGAVHVSHIVSQVYDEVNTAQANPQEIYGIPTGLLDWDRTTFGLQRGTKILLSGDPGIGKSALAVQVLIHAAGCGIPGALYELEMSGQQVIRRALANASQVPTQKMRQGKMDDADAVAFTHAVEQVSSLPLYISTATSLTTAEMRADLIRLKENHGVQLVVLDYEGLLEDEMGKNFAERSTIISKRTHDIAKDLNIALIAIADMTKEGIKGQANGQGALGGTGRSLHDADEIIVLRKDESKPNTVNAMWAKNREGRADCFISLVRKPGFPVFVDAATTRQTGA